MENFNFYNLVNSLGLHVSVSSLSAPASPGVYMLFDDAGRFVYIGKADNLRDRLSDHFSLSETNLLIRVFAKLFVWQVTPTVEAAELEEGKIYDIWLESAGYAPLANQVAPPKSKYAGADENTKRLRLLLAKIKQITG